MEKLKQTEFFLFLREKTKSLYYIKFKRVKRILIFNCTIIFTVICTKLIALFEHNLTTFKHISGVLMYGIFYLYIL